MKFHWEWVHLGTNGYVEDVGHIQEVATGEKFLEYVSERLDGFKHTPIYEIVWRELDNT